jgi:hypothetical protein
LIKKKKKKKSIEDPQVTLSHLKRLDFPSIHGTHATHTRN